MRLGLGLGLSRTGTSSGGGGGGPTPSYTFLGEATTNATGSVHTYSVDIGAASAVRYILLSAVVQNPDPVPVSVTVAGVALTLLSTAGTPSSASWMNVFYGGLVTTGSGAQNAVVTWTSASFEQRRMALWSLLDLASTTPKASGAQVTGLPDQVVTVDAGDLVFFSASTAGGLTSTFGNTSTPVPTGQRSATAQLYTADWLISSSGSLTINTVNVPSNKHYISFA